MDSLGPNPPKKDLTSLFDMPAGEAISGADLPAEEPEVVDTAAQLDMAASDIVASDAVAPEMVAFDTLAPEAPPSVNNLSSDDEDSLNALMNMASKELLEDDGPPIIFQSESLNEENFVAERNLDSVKDLGQHVAIGKPLVEGAPPFSLMVSFIYDEKKENRIKDLLTQENYGVSYRDIEVQLKSGKLFIPKISEFSAIALAQKLREFVDNIELDLSEEIYKSNSFTPGLDAATYIEHSDFENILFDAERLESHKEEAHDMGAEPKNERDLFTTNLDHLDGKKITRVLSALIVSKVIDNDAVEDKDDTLLERETESLVKELITKAFQLGAHGVLGVTFTIKPYETFTTLGKKRGYRLWGTGTAVRVTTITGTQPEPQA